MSVLDARTTVGDLVRERPSRARVFERLGIDYCCGGKVPLETVCQKRGLNSEAVLRELSDHDGRTVEPESEDWTKAALTALADHIIRDHHGYLRRELPRLEAMVNRIAEVHGLNHPELLELRSIFASLKPNLEFHTTKEESVLFPWIKQLDASSGAPPVLRGTVANPIRMMESEHDDAGNALKRIRELTRDFQPPYDACNTYRATLDGLAEFEADLHLHVHKENNILFPGALALETKLAAAVPAQ